MKQGNFLTHWLIFFTEDRPVLNRVQKGPLSGKMKVLPKQQYG